MDAEQVFKETRLLFKKAKIPIAKAEYSIQQFGTWWIIAQLDKSLLRAVWNSRDRWLVIQSLTEEVVDGQFQWKEEWTMKRREDVTAEHITDRFLKIYGKLAKKA